MPTATSFTALGRGNGFPFCATRKDVSGFTNWITLGGVSSGSASTSQINESLVNAMKLWWNLNSITGSFSASSTNSDGDDLSISATNHQLIIKRDGESDPLAPIQRTCRGTSSSISGNDDDLRDSFSKNDRVEDENDRVDGSMFIGAGNFIVRMYNGSTDNESNFVGYGVRELASVSAEASIRGVFLTINVEVSSFQMGTNGSDTDPASRIKFDQKVFQTNLGGIPFRSKTHIVAAADNLSLSASELSGSATGSSSTTTTPVFSSSADISASLSTSIDFYTY